MKLQSLEDEGQFKNGWLICTQGKSFAVYAATATEKQEWMAHIDKVILIPIWVEEYFNRRNRITSHLTFYHLFLFFDYLSVHKGFA